MPKTSFTPLIEWAYSQMAPINMDWDGRHTPEGQALLASMRDFLASQAKVDAETLQDLYSRIIRA